MPNIRVRIARIGNVIEVEVPRGSSIAAALEAGSISVRDDATLHLNGSAIERSEWATTSLDEEDALILLASPIRGELPTPKLKEVLAFLRRHGFKRAAGKGDHEKYTAPDGTLIVVNPAKRDSKHIDLGTAKQLAKYLGVNLYELHAALGQ